MKDVRRICPGAQASSPADQGKFMDEGNKSFILYSQSWFKHSLIQYQTLCQKAKYGKIPRVQASSPAEMADITDKMADLD